MRTRAVLARRFHRARPVGGPQVAKIAKRGGQVVASIKLIGAEAWFQRSISAGAARATN